MDIIRSNWIGIVDIYYEAIQLSSLLKLVFRFLIYLFLIIFLLSEKGTTDFAHKIIYKFVQDQQCQDTKT